ncbi:hypothetical protein AAVH_34108, partial [Aphelenchoides avenae]
QKQQNSTGQLPRPQMPNSGAQSQHPQTQQNRTMQRQMSTLQHNLADNDHDRWTNANDTPHRMTLQRGRAGQRQIPVERQFTGTKNSFTSPYANSGSHSSVFNTPTATPVVLRDQSQYASDSMRLQKFTASNSSVQQNN